MRSLPIQVRLTLAFAVSMAIAYIALGVFIHLQFRNDLEHAIDQGLSERIDLAASAEQGHLTQRFDRTGAVIAASPDLRGARLLTTAEARRAARHRTAIERRSVGGNDLRVFAAPFGSGAAAVGEPLRVSDSEVDRLRTLLLVAFPIALLLASYAGYEVAGAALAPLERVRARERRLVADASHELRTPLTVLRTELQLALRGDRDKPQLREALENALEEAERLGRLADDLLILARADQGDLPLHREPLDIAPLLAERADHARAQAGRRAITVSGDGVLNADRDRVVQALDNLVYNAISHGDGEI